jgi:hypothetical protein
LTEDMGSVGFCASSNWLDMLAVFTKHKSLVFGKLEGRSSPAKHAD